jgi:hypothetical protein
VAIERSKVAGFWELSLIGQFRAVDRDKARLFAQAVADAAKAMGLNDCGYDVRKMSGEVFDDEAARMQLLNDTWRPEWGPKPWENDPVPSELFPENVPHSEVQKALRRGDGEEG